MNARSMDFPQADYPGNAALHNSSPLVAKFVIFDDILFGHFFQEVQITQSHTPKI
jgi:hypothetical protein